MIADISLWTRAATTTARQVDLLFGFLVIVCGAVGTLVAVLLIFFCIRYRRRSHEIGNPPPTNAYCLSLPLRYHSSPG